MWKVTSYLESDVIMWKVTTDIIRINPEKYLPVAGGYPQGAGVVTRSYSSSSAARRKTRDAPLRYVDFIHILSHIITYYHKLLCTFIVHFKIRFERRHTMTLN